MKCPKCGEEMHLDELGNNVWLVCDHCLIKMSPYTEYDNSDMPEKPAKHIRSVYSIPLLISLFIGIAYLIYSAFYWSTALSAVDGSLSIGSGIALLAVLPHLIFSALAVLFNLLGFCIKNKWLALTDAILYTVSAVLFPLYSIFVVAEAILSFVAFGTMSKPRLKSSTRKRALIAVLIIGFVINISIMYSGLSGNSYITSSPVLSNYSDDLGSVSKNAPSEYKSALKKAKSYSDTMYMSKASIYNQLTSEYGEKFSPEAAQYAIDNLDADWNANALKKAENYSDTMYMSKASIYDQLISEYGEMFTPEEAQYAIDNISADWKANALKKAKSYQDSMSMSPSAIYDQLISEYGEKFTKEEAQYAIDNLE